MLIYNLIILLISIILYPFFSLHKRGRNYLHERYGIWNISQTYKANNDTKEIIWMHGASAGEIKGLAPIINKIKENFKNELILLTTISDKGKETALALPEFANSKNVFLLPFDSIFLYPKFLKESKIKLFICAETEIWPGLYEFLHSRNIPVFIVNARISDKTFPLYKLFSFFTKRFLKDTRKIFCSDRKSIDRFVTLGAEHGNIELSGNAKYETLPNKEIGLSGLKLRDSIIGNSLPIVVLGSLRTGEEQYWFKVISDEKLNSKFNFIVVPRHLDKLKFFVEELKKFKIDYRIWEKGEAQIEELSNSAHVILINEFGVLEALYSVADIAFVGGSLIAVGGHNPLEPAEYSVPILMGPHYQNVQELVEEMINQSAIKIVKNDDQIKEILLDYLLDNAKLKVVAENAYKLKQFYQGTAQRVVEEIIRNMSV